MASFRIEKDSLGEMKIPDTADYGIHTARAVERIVRGNKPVPTGLKAG